MTRKSLESLTLREKFRPFKIVTSAGVAYDITDAGGLALGRSELFYYVPRSDHSVHIPDAHIATIEEVAGAKLK